MEIERLNKRQLLAHIRSKDYKSQAFLPISGHRAMSHIANPRADEDDILLLLAYEDGKLLGYLGALPDYMFYGEGQHEKCAWLSCMWIDEGQRGKRIAQQLIAACLDAWKNRILVTEFTVAAKGLYDKSGVFEDLAINKGIRLYLRSDTFKLLPPKRKIFSSTKYLLRGFDAVVNSILDLRFNFYRKHRLKIEYPTMVDAETEHFISGRQQGQVFRRSAHELNWILRNPWILAGPENEMSRKYHFSSVDRSFNFYPVKLRDQHGKLIAYFIFSKRDRTLKLPYFYMEPGMLEQAMAVIREHLVHWRISTFTVFHPDIVSHLEASKTIALHKKSVKRHYIISKALHELLGSGKVVIQDGDADCAFT